MNDNNFVWDDNKVIDFVSWYLKVCKLPDRLEIENQYIIDSFKNGDAPEVWFNEDPRRRHKQDGRW